MNVFSVLSDPDNPISLSESSYHKATQRAHPYVQIRDGETKCYALCPSCKNPVHLRNRIVKNTVAKTLYAAHVAFSVAGLAEYSQERYQICPLANPQRLDRAGGKKHPGAVAADLKRFFLENADLVIDFLEKRIGLALPDYARENMLKDFGANRAFEYAGVTKYNLPLAFAYLTEAQAMTGFEIMKNQQGLAAAITGKCQDFEVTSRGVRQYISRKKTGEVPTSRSSKLYLSFHDHEISKEQPEKQTVTMVVNETPDPKMPDVYREIYRQSISLDGVLFLRTCLRRARLLSMAKAHIG
ncbi:hypothetical protein V6W80_14985 [Pseudomonas benzopyrenica]|uniref:Uncharacterized protein n=1 Tax=Pseudomonas benzopyrenica TaxID=2993566 RepID=A0ABZ2FM82_9PSED